MSRTPSTAVFVRVCDKLVAVAAIHDTKALAGSVDRILAIESRSTYNYIASNITYEITIDICEGVVNAY